MVSVTLLGRMIDEWQTYITNYLYNFLRSCPKDIVFHYLTLMYNYKAENIANLCLRFVN